MAENQIRSVRLKRSIRESIREGLALVFGLPSRTVHSVHLHQQSSACGKSTLCSKVSGPTVRLGETNELQGLGGRCQASIARPCCRRGARGPKLLVCSMLFDGAPPGGKTHVGCWGEVDDIRWNKSRERFFCVGTTIREREVKGDGCSSCERWIERSRTNLSM